LRPITTSYGKLVQVKLLHSVKEHNPITMSKLRLALLELPKNHAVRVSNRPPGVIFPVSG
jgi:hypothetical protein